MRENLRYYIVESGKSVFVFKNEKDAKEKQCELLTQQKNVGLRIMAQESIEEYLQKISTKKAIRLEEKH